MSKNAVVTGAGSGVGQATALKLAAAGWRVALLGRRADALAETVRLAGTAGGQFLVCPTDIGDAAAVAATAATILAAFGEVELLVNAAGTNAPQRALEVLSLPDYHGMMNANLNGAYYCVQAFLPGMRARGSGTIVNIVSDAGKQASPKAGPAYVMSKFGLAGLTQAARERMMKAEDIADCALFCALLPSRVVVEEMLVRPR
jgi:NADP-dependent 3-hydroxy acid dehydrogenase YdfG